MEPACPRCCRLAHERADALIEKLEECGIEPTEMECREIYLNELQRIASEPLLDDHD